MIPYKTFNDPPCGVWNEDCSNAMLLWAKHNQFEFDLVFGDPPFGIGVEYDGFKDELDYLDFSLRWMNPAANLLSPGGRLYVHVPDQCVYPVLKAASETMLVQDEWIIWHYRFGQHKDSGFINSKCHGLVFTRMGDKEKPIFNANDVLVDSDRASKYDDPRTQNKKGGIAGKRVPLDVWGIDEKYFGRVQGNSKERRSLHPNQLPEVYMERIIRAYTNKDSWVLDPFGGSGTTAVVARALDRRVITIEQSEKYCGSICERIEKGAVRL